MLSKKPGPAAAIAVLGLALSMAGPLDAQTSTPMRAEALASRDQAVETRLNSLLGELTLNQKIDLIGGVDGFFVRPMPNIGLPRLKTSDGPMGARNDGPATAMAGGIGLAATWDVDVARQVGTQIGRDARARGVHFMLGPGVNIYRSPTNGRNFEYFGEDPFLSSRMAVNYIVGMQSQGVSATVKHFMGNNSEFDRHNTDSIIDERTMREIYLPAFEAAVKEAHVGSIMDSYNLINSEHATQNGFLNTVVAKQEWGFDGVMMSDWVSTYDGVAAANGGLDLEMPSGAFMNRKNLLPAIKANNLTTTVIDDKVRRLLRTAVRFGWLDRDQTDLSIPRDSQRGARVALQAAREGMVLLKNDGNLLPLSKEHVRSIAVIGPDAYPAVPVGGGSAQVVPYSSLGVMEALSKYLGTRGSVYYNRGIATWSQLANATKFMTEASNGKPGVTVETFDDPDLAGRPTKKVERHINQKPPFTIADFAEMDMGELFADLEAGNSGPRPKGTSTRYTGYYTAEAAGDYEVFAEAPGESGGNRLFIDGKPILDSWKIRKAFIDDARISLAAGPHKVVFEKFGAGGFDVFGSMLRLGIAPVDKLVDPTAKALAAEADVVVIAAGFDPESESEGGDRTFSLPFGQNELIKQIASVNKRTVVVVTSGGAFDANAWLSQVPALVEAWYPGQEGGQAFAEILFGDANPCGHLPISFDRTLEENPTHASYYPEPGSNKVVYKEGVFVGYRGYEHEGRKPLFPFGFGLSYTSFKYSGLLIKPEGNGADGKFDVSFSITNTGRLRGADVAQVYVGEKQPSVPRPVKELKGFARVDLQPGETRSVTVPLNARAFAYFDPAEKRWKVNAGDFDVLVGHSSQTIDLSGEVKIPSAMSLR